MCRSDGRKPIRKRPSENRIPPFSDGLCASSGIIKAGILRIGSSGFVSQGTGYFLVSVKPVQPNNSVSTRHR